MRLRRSAVTPVVLAGAAIHGLAVLLAPEVPIVVGDAPSYVLLARNLAAGHGFSLSETAPFVPTLFRTPGYPLFLLLATVGLRLPLAAAALLQIVMLLAVGAVVARLAEERGSPRWVAVAAGLLAVALPPLESFALVLLGEIVGLFLTVSAVVAIGRGRREGAATWWLVAGVAAGAAMLVRIESVVLVPILIAMAAAPDSRSGVGPVRGLARPFGRRCARRFALRCGLALAGFAVVVAPWVVRNERVFGRPAPTGDLFSVVPRGYASWTLTWQDHPRFLQDAYWDVWAFGRYRPEAFPERAFTDAEERRVVDSLLTAVRGPDLRASSADSVFAELARRRGRARPFKTFVEVPLRRIAMTWIFLPINLPLMPGFVGPVDRGRDLLSWRAGAMLISIAASLGLLVGGLVGSVRVAMLRTWSMAPFAALFLWRVVLIGWLVHPEPRYALPALPISALLTALVFAPRSAAPDEAA